MTCPSCGSPTAEAARYCANCGHGLRAERGDERRVATVLFADLVGYTTLAEGRDPEHVKNLVDRCFERLAADVVAHGGRVDKIVGDAIMALFGAPTAHEDDAERAVRAGLAMHRTLAHWSSELDVDIHMRVGVNTGEVLVGALRAGGDYTAMGDVVNTASRLQQAAEAGQVLVGPATHAATRDAVRYRSVGVVRAKGREEPVPAWVAIEAVAPPGHRPRRVRTPLVGRTAEVGLLRHALSLTAERRRPAVVLLSGEAGTGKSRLAEELARIGRAEYGAAVLEGRCVPYGEANVWWPLGEALRRSCGITDDDDHAVAKAKGMAAVAALLGVDAGDRELHRVLRGLTYLIDEDEMPGLEPGRARDEAVRSMAVCLERMTRDHPLVFIVSELHWADGLLLELIDRLLDRVQHLPVLLVATARPELAERWHPPAGRHHQLLLHVEPLDAAATGDLLAALLEGPVPRERRDALVERSGGNPLFLEELVALLAADQPVDELPVTLRGLIAARLDALGPVERTTLEDAAVMGRSGSVAGLVAMGAGPVEVEQAVAALVGTELLSAAAGAPGEAPAWEFRSELVREVAYGTLTKAERARRHARLATWLEGRAGDRPTAAELDELAHHFGTAAELVVEVGGISGVADDLVPAALRWVREAAHRAEAEELWRSATGLLDQALRLVGSERAEREQLLLARARARIGLREVAGAGADLEEVLRAAAARGDRALEARGLVLTGELERVEGRLDDSTRTLQRAVELAGALGDAQCTADALRALGQTRVFAADDVGADRASSEALAAYRSLGDRRGEAWALQSLAWTAFMRGDLGPAEERLHASAGAFSEIGDWGGHAWAQGLLAWVRFTQGRLDEAGRLGEEVLDEAKDSGDAWALAMMTVLDANVSLWQGRTVHAATQAAEACRLFRGLQDPWGECQALVPHARARLALGEVARGRDLLDELAALQPRLVESRMGRVGDLGIVVARAQQLGEGAEVMDLVGATAGVAPEWAASDHLGLLGLCQLQAGDLPAAVRTLQQAADGYDDGLEGHPSLAATLALALLATDRVDDAAATLDRGVPPGAGTYADQTWAALGWMFVAARRGEPSGVQAFMSVACSMVDATEDRLLQATVRLAEAVAEAAMGTDRAPAAALEAERRAAAVGAELPGWRAVFELAAGVRSGSFAVGGAHGEAVRLPVGLDTPLAPLEGTPG